MSMSSLRVNEVGRSSYHIYQELRKRRKVETQTGLIRYTEHERGECTSSSCSELHFQSRPLRHGLLPSPFIHLHSVMARITSAGQYPIKVGGRLHTHTMIHVWSPTLAVALLDTTQGGVQLRSTAFFPFTHYAVVSTEFRLIE